MTDEFYVGWQETSPPSFARRTRAAALVLLVAALSIGALVAASQSVLPPAAFEFGVVRSFEGTLVSDPYPALRVERPGQGGGTTRFLLVAQGKHGAEELAAELDGRAVTLSGTLIHHGGRTMIEVVPGTIEVAGEGATGGPGRVRLGRHTLVGEVADSKCHLGVMNPGRDKVHRACAVLCIRGGIPPLLLVDREDGSVERYLLVARDGSAVNDDVLALVADTVEITGEVEREDDLLFLRADPSGYRRLEDRTP